VQVNRLAGELSREQENYKNAEAVRKSLEVEIREISVKLEEAESFAQREGKRLIAKLQARVSAPLLQLSSELATFNSNFYPRDAMLARLLALCLCLCLCLSVCLCLCVTSRCSVETDERIGLAFDVGASFDLSYTVLEGNSGIFRNKVTSFRNFACSKRWT